MKKLALAIFILAFLGAGISLFLYIQHIGFFSTEICEINATFDCKSVDQSVYSEIFGIPISLLGIIGYTLMMIGAFLKFVDKKKDRGLDYFIMIVTAGGFAFSLYLTSIEAFVLKVWCIFCISSQIVMLAIFILAMLLFIRGRHDIIQTEEIKPESYG